MRSVRRGFLMLVLAGMGALANAADHPWETINQGEKRDEVTSWVRAVDGMAVKQFRGVIEVRQSPLAVLALIADVSAMPKWVFNSQKTEFPGGTPGDKAYARFDGVFPASDRDVLIQTSIVQQPDFTIVVTNRGVDGYPKQDSYVRMPYLFNTFRLTPLKEGWTRVEFDTQVDLGGLVPAWLANLVSKKAPLVTLEGLQKEVAKSKYQIKSSKELPAYFTKGLNVVVPDLK